MKKSQKLIYIISPGHTGSTLLDMIIGSIPDVFSMGEICHYSYVKRHIIPGSQMLPMCSCGKITPECNIWGRVLHDIGEIKDVSLNRSTKHTGEKVYFYEKIGYYLLNQMLYKSVKYPFKIIFNLYFKIFKKNIEDIWSLFDNVFETTGCNYLVDSSKDINRLLLLNKLRPNQIIPVVLVRDIYGSSASKHYKPKERLKMADKWLLFQNYRLDTVYNNFREDEIAILKYEDMVSNPNLIRQVIAEKIGVSVNIPAINTLNPRNYHLFWGNPLRMKNLDMKIKNDESWKLRLSTDDFDYISEVRKKLKPKRDYWNNTDIEK